MNLFLAYDKDTGEIIASMVGSPGISAQINGVSYPLVDVGGVDSISDSNPMARFSPDRYYVSVFGEGKPQVCSRPEQQTVVNKTEILLGEEAIFSNIPRNATVRIDGDAHTVPDEILYFSPEHVGTYEFTFECFPYLDKAFSITVME